MQLEPQNTIINITTIVLAIESAVHFYVYI